MNLPKKTLEQIGAAIGREHPALKQAKGRKPHVPGEPNKLEREYGEYLAARKFAGEVLWYAFESMTLRLAEDCRLTPDYFALMADLSLEVHEVKGPYKREDSIIKLRVASAMFPFRFLMVEKDVENGWKFTDFSS